MRSRVCSGQGATRTSSLGEDASGRPSRSPTPRFVAMSSAPNATAAAEAASAAACASAAAEAAAAAAFLGGRDGLRPAGNVRRNRSPERVLIVETAHDSAAAAQQGHLSHCPRRRHAHLAMTCEVASAQCIQLCASESEATCSM